MIVFKLQCTNGHAFDEWFKSSAEFEEKSKAGDLECPECGDTRVAKGIMAPAVKGSSPDPAPAPSCATGGCASGMCPLG